MLFLSWWGLQATKLTCMKQTGIWPSHLLCVSLTFLLLFLFHKMYWAWYLGFNVANPSKEQDIEWTKNAKLWPLTTYADSDLDLTVLKHWYFLTFFDTANFPAHFYVVVILITSIIKSKSYKIWILLCRYDFILTFKGVARAEPNSK